MECIYRCTSTEEESGEELDAFDEQGLMRGSLQNGRSKRKWFGRKTKSKQEDPIAEKVSKYGLDPSSPMLDNHPLLIPRKKRASLKDTESRNVKNAGRGSVQLPVSKSSDVAAASRYTKISDKESNRSMKRPASASMSRDSKGTSQSQLFRGRGRGEYQKCDSQTAFLPDRDLGGVPAATKTRSSNGFANSKVDDPIPRWSNRSTESHAREMSSTQANAHDVKRQSFASTTSSLSKHSPNASYNNSAHGSFHSSSAHSMSQQIAQLDMTSVQRSPSVRKLSLSAHSYESIASFSNISKSNPSSQARFHEYQAEDWIMGPSMATTDEASSRRVNDLNEQGRVGGRGSSEQFVHHSSEGHTMDDRLHSLHSNRSTLVPAVKSFTSEESDNPDTRPLLAPLSQPNPEVSRKYPITVPPEASAARSAHDGIPFLRRRASPSHGLIETDEDDSIHSEDGKSVSSRASDSVDRFANVWNSRENTDMPDREYSGPVDLDDMTIPSRASDSVLGMRGRDEIEEDETIRSEEIYDEYIDLAIYEERLDRALLSDAALPDFEIMRKLELMKYPPSEEDEELSNIEANPSFDSVDATRSIEQANPSRSDGETSDGEYARQPLVLIQSSDTSCEISLMQVLDESSEGTNEYIVHPAAGEAYIADEMGEDWEDDESHQQSGSFSEELRKQMLHPVAGEANIADKSEEDSGDSEFQPQTVTFADEPQTHIIPALTDERYVTDESDEDSVEEAEVVPSPESSIPGPHETEGNADILDSTFDEEIVFHTDESSTPSSSDVEQDTDMRTPDDRRESTIAEALSELSPGKRISPNEEQAMGEKTNDDYDCTDSQDSNLSSAEAYENGDGGTSPSVSSPPNESLASKDIEATGDIHSGQFSTFNRHAVWNSNQVVDQERSGQFSMFDRPAAWKSNKVVDQERNGESARGYRLRNLGGVESSEESYRDTIKPHNFQATVENYPSHFQFVRESRPLEVKSSHYPAPRPELEKSGDRSELARMGNGDSTSRTIAAITSRFEQDLAGSTLPSRNFRSMQKSPQHMKPTAGNKLGENKISSRFYHENGNAERTGTNADSSPRVIKDDENKRDSEVESTVSLARSFWASVEKSPLSKETLTSSTGRAGITSNGLRAGVSTPQDAGETVIGRLSRGQTKRSSPGDVDSGGLHVASSRATGEKWPLNIYRKQPDLSPKPSRDAAAAFIPKEAITSPKNGIRRGYNPFRDGISGKQTEKEFKDVKLGKFPATTENSPVLSNDKKPTVASRFADLKSKFDSAASPPVQIKDERKSETKIAETASSPRKSSPTVDMRESQSTIESEVSVSQARNFWAAVDKSPKNSESKAGIGSRVSEVKMRCNDGGAPALNSFLARNSIDRYFQANENTDASSKDSSDPGEASPEAAKTGAREKGDKAGLEPDNPAPATLSQNESTCCDQESSTDAHVDLSKSDSSQAVPDVGRRNGTSGVVVQQKLTPGSDPQKWHDTLKEYEARRRLKFQKKLNTTKLHWKSYRDMLEDGSREVARARRLVLGLTKAQGKLARTMAECPVESSTQKESAILKLIKGNSQHSPKSVVSSRSNGDPSSIQNGPGSLLLDSLSQARNLVIKTTSGVATDAEVNLESRLNNLTQFLQDTLTDLDQGAVILDELVSLEERTQQAWDSYLQATSGTLQTENSAGILGTLFRGTSSNRSIGSLANPSKSNASDSWLAEAKYKECSEIQRRAVEDANIRLQEIFETARNAECFRRLNLREYLIDCVQQQQRVFQSTEESISLVLVTLLERENDGLEEHKICDETSAPDVQVGSMGDGKIATFFLDQYSLLAPLESDMLVHMSVGEVLPRDPGSKPSLTLLTVTSDSILHFFDLFGTGLNVNSRAEDALTALLNQSKAAYSGNGRRLRALRPSWTFELGNCKISAGIEDYVVELRVDNPSQRGDWELKIRVGSTREQIALIAGMHGDSSRTQS